jgi:hypothetical protein
VLAAGAVLCTREREFSVTGQTNGFRCFTKTVDLLTAALRVLREQGNYHEKKKFNPRNARFYSYSVKSNQCKIRV